MPGNICSNVLKPIITYPGWGRPAGLSAALLLSRYKIQVLLVERHPGTSIHPRARGLNVRTMEIFRELGLESAVRQAGSLLADISTCCLWKRWLDRKCAVSETTNYY